MPTKVPKIDGRQTSQIDDLGMASMWGIHSGKTGDAHSLFIERSVVAIGWPRCGDVRELRTIERLKSCIQAAYPEKKPGAIPGDAGMLFKFLCVMRPGDLVVYPSTKIDRMINIGQVIGEPEYHPEWSAQYPNTRAVKWLANHPRTSFSQGALYEIGSAISFFQVRNYADEFRATVEGKRTPEAVESDDSAVAPEIEEQTRDFIIKRLSQHLKGLPLEDFVVHLLECMGYHARRTPNGEPSVDIIAHKDELGFEAPRIKVQVKSSDEKITDRDVSALYGKLGPSESGLVVALSDYHRDLRHYAASRGNLRLIGGVEVQRLVEFFAV